MKTLRVPHITTMKQLTDTRILLNKDVKFENISAIRLFLLNSYNFEILEK